MLQRHQRIGKTDPHCSADLGRVSDEPGVVVLLRRARLAGDGAADPGLLTGTATHDFRERRGHRVGNAGVERSGHHRDRLYEPDPVGVANPGHEYRLNVGAPRGEGAEGRCHLQHRHLLGTERDRVIRLETGRDPHRGGQVDHPLRADGIDDLRVDDID